MDFVAVQGGLRLTDVVPRKDWQIDPKTGELVKAPFKIEERDAESTILMPNGYPVEVIRH
jgi:hypothetical protein